MQWDLGLQGLAMLGAISLGFGVVAAFLVGRGWAHRLWATVITTVACFGVGVLTSEWLFGWATEEDLQPNIDGLSRDEVLLSSVVTTAFVVLAMRYVTRRSQGTQPHQGQHLTGGHRHGWGQSMIGGRSGRSASPTSSEQPHHQGDQSEQDQEF